MPTPPPSVCNPCDREGAYRVFLVAAEAETKTLCRGKPEVGEQVLVNENEPATVTTSDVSGFGKFLTSFLAGLFHETEAGVYFVEVQATLVPVDGKSCGVPWLVICLHPSPLPPSLPLRSSGTMKKRASSKLKCASDCSCLTPLPPSVPSSLEPMLIKSRNWILSGISVN